MRMRGFTLIEMILTIIIGSILVLGIAGFVELGSRGYADTVARQRIQTQAKFVLEKIAREVRHAVPNSFAITESGSQQQCLSFYPIVYSGFYHLEAKDSKQLSFVVGNHTGDSVGLDFTGLKMIVNPTHYREFDLAFSDETVFPSMNGSHTTITLNKPLASQSVGQRFYLYRDAVVYCLNFAGHTMTRNDIQVADSVVTGQFRYAFRYAEPTLQRGGVVHLSLSLAQNGEHSDFEQDVQVLNVP